MHQKSDKSHGRNRAKQAGRTRISAGRKTVTKAITTEELNNASIPAKKGRKSLKRAKKSTAHKKVHLGKKSLKKIKKSIKKLEKVSQQAIIAKDKISQIVKLSARTRVKIANGKKEGITRLKLQRLRSKLKSLRTDLKQGRLELIGINKKIRIRRDKIRLLKAGK